MWPVEGWESQMTSGSAGRSEAADVWAWRCWRGFGENLVVIKARDLATLFDYVREINATTIVLDIEPWLIHWTAPSNLLAQRLADFRRQAPGSSAVVLCTNSRRFKSASIAAAYVGRARKPWTSRRRIGPLGDRPVVVGDSLLLDGLLALRMRAAFVWLQWEGETPLWPRLIHAVDRFVGSVLLTAAPAPERFL
jgi:hypothetical protein